MIFIYDILMLQQSENRGKPNQMPNL